MALCPTCGLPGLLIDDDAALYKCWGCRLVVEEIADAEGCECACGCLYCDDEGAACRCTGDFCTCGVVGWPAGSLAFDLRLPIPRPRPGRGDVVVAQLFTPAGSVFADLPTYPYAAITPDVAKAGVA